jgi:hypothetical protein
LSLETRDFHFSHRLLARALILLFLPCHGLFGRLHDYFDISEQNLDHTGKMKGTIISLISEVRKVLPSNKPLKNRLPLRGVNALQCKAIMLSLILQSYSILLLGDFSVLVQLSLVEG